MFRRGREIGHDDALGAIAFSQGGNQFGADLAERAGDQESSHVFRPAAITPTRS